MHCTCISENSLRLSHGLLDIDNVNNSIFSIGTWKRNQDLWATPFEFRRLYVFAPAYERAETLT